MSPATKLGGGGGGRGGARNLRLAFAAVWATYTVSLIEICPVDAAECRPIIEDFDRPLMLYGH